MPRVRPPPPSFSTRPSLHVIIHAHPLVFPPPPCPKRVAACLTHTVGPPCCGATSTPAARTLAGRRRTRAVIVMPPPRTFAVRGGRMTTVPNPRMLPPSRCCRPARTTSDDPPVPLCRLKYYYSLLATPRVARSCHSVQRSLASRPPVLPLVQVRRGQQPAGVSNANVDGCRR